MLQLTQNASNAIGTLIDRPELPESAGLRISAAGPGSDQLAVAATGTPEASDEVIEDGGARVFLDANAAAVLDDKVLDAKVTDQGNVQFMVAAQQ